MSSTGHWGSHCCSADRVIITSVARGHLLDWSDGDDNDDDRDDEELPIVVRSKRMGDVRQMVHPYAHAYRHITLIK
jgi:hypothetical protein